jgi:hypothetical protein
MNTETTDPKILTTRVSLAEAAMAKLSAKCAELAEKEREATRALATDPCEANAGKVREVRSALDDWRAGLTVATKNLEAARADVDAVQSRELASKSREHAARASRPAFRANIAPHVLAFVAGVRALENELSAMMAISLAQQADVEAADHFAVGAGIALPGVPALGGAHLAAEVLVALSDADLKSYDLHRWVRAIPQVPGSDSENILCKSVFDRLDLGSPRRSDEMPFREQIEAALNGEDIHARVAERVALESRVA